VSFVVKKNKALYPIQITGFSADTIVPQADSGTNLFQKRGFVGLTHEFDLLGCCNTQ